MNRKTIRGVVIPVKWDECGDVAAVAIATRDEDEYFIDNSDKAHQLLRYLNADVEVDGSVRIDDGVKTMVIEELRLKKLWRLTKDLGCSTKQYSRMKGEKNEKV